MVVALFYRKIKTLAIDSFFSFSDLVATIVTYFDFNTSSTEIEVALAVNKICAATGLGFRNQYGNPVFCNPNEPHPAHFTYSDFRSVMRADSFDIWGPDSEFSFDFLLNLSQNFVNKAVPVVSNIASPFPNLTPTTNTKDDLETLQFDPCNLAEDHVDSLPPADMRVLLKPSISVIVSPHSAALKKSKTNPSTPFGVANLSTTPVTIIISVIPKMEQVFVTSSVSIVITYTGALDFMENCNQAILVLTFGINPILLLLVVAKKGIPVEDICI